MTVSIGLIENFDQLSSQTAIHIIYDEIIPRCEKKGIRLCSYGNDVPKQTLSSVKIYDREKKERRLFNIERIQKAFKDLDEVIANTTIRSVGSYHFKHNVQDYQKEYITNGDCIIAMLVKGYSAHFASPSLHVHCQFTLR